MQIQKQRLSLSTTKTKEGMAIMYHHGTSQQRDSSQTQDCVAGYETDGLGLSCQNEEISFLQERSGKNCVK